MKAFIVLFNLLIFTKYNVNCDSLLYKNINCTLNDVLNFIENKYHEVRFDGLFGITFAKAFLLKSLDIPLQDFFKNDLLILINKCSRIYNKIYPLLPNNPKYMITFRKRLLDAMKWKNILPNNFSYGKIKYLGYYNWTPEFIINNKEASYKGVKSDVCLREILQLSQPSRNCYVSDVCQEMMLDNNRIDIGYLLTHRLLYLQIIKSHGCLLPNKFGSIESYVIKFCSYIYKEAVTSDKLNFPHYDIFLEQIVLCGMEGNAEFLNLKWLIRIIGWKNPYGCYENTRHNNISKRTSFAIGFGCSDHTTGLAAAALALHLRYLFETQLSNDK